MILSDFSNKYNKVNSLIEKGEIKRALELTGDITTLLKAKPEKNNLTELFSRFNRASSSYHISGTIDFKEYSLEVNRIIEGLLHFLPTLEKIYEQSVQEEYYSSKKEKGTSKIIVEGNSITKTFSNFSLYEVNFSLSTSRIVGLIGENGSGKSTLLNIIAGRIPITEGELIFADFKDNNWFNIKQNLFYVPQFIPEWTWGLKQTLNYYGVIRGGLNRHDSENETNYIISRLGLNDFQNNSWNTLSGGFKTRFELARAIICKPKILLLDEPLAHLDIKIQSEFLQNVKDLCEISSSPLAVLLSSQHINEIETIVDDLIVLEKGALKFFGNKNEILKNFKHNEIEVITHLGIDEISLLLNELSDNIILKKIGILISISFPINILPSKLITYLIEKGVRIDYFRDISNSSKRFLYSQ